MNETKYITSEVLNETCPAAFATQPIPGASERYSFLSTFAIVNALKTRGWQLVQADQGHARKPELAGYQKHMLRFQNPALKPINGTIPVIVLINGHNRLTGLRFYVGLFRMICSNGLIVSVGPADVLRRKHINTNIEDVLRVAAEMENKVVVAIERMRRFTAIELTDAQQLSFAREALKLRYPERAPITAEKVLEMRRGEDEGRDLWTVMNRVQENIVKGGMQGTNARNRRMNIREIRNINRNVHINTSLWQLAEKVAA